MRPQPGTKTPGAEVAPQDTPAARIVSAAGSCYDRYGIGRATVDEIALAAGVSKPTIYRYFPSRGDLVFAVVSARAWALREQASAYIDQRTGIDAKIVEGILHIGTRVRRDAVLRLLLIPEPLESLGQLENGSRLAIEVNAALWLPVLRAARESGEIPEHVDVDRLCRWLLFVELITVNRVERSPGAKRDHRTTLRNMVLPALRPPPATR